MKLLLLFSAFVLPFINHAQNWQSVGSGLNGSAHCLATYNGKLVVGGSFNNNPCDRIALWDGSNYECLGNGVGIVARAAIVWNGNLVVVGDFWNNFQPCVGCNGIAMWDGTQWLPLGTGFNNDVLCLGLYNGQLLAGGDFTQANGAPCNRIARWTGSTWEQLGGINDFNNDVRCITEFDDELWIGGDFTNVGGCNSCDGVVKYDDATNTWLGGNSGVDIVGGVNETIRVLHVNPNDGNLYMGGEFYELQDGDAAAPDPNMSGIAMYDGSNWYPLGSGLNEYCRAIHEYNGNLIAGGWFTTAGGVSANRIAKWNGSTWSPMGLGFDASGIDEYVKAAEVWNGIFFAGGAYTQAEGNTMNYISQWYEAPSNPPVASINASTTSICTGSCINFADNSTNSPSAWTWSFPGGTVSSSSQQNPGSICYTTPGNYSVTLQACNGSGCNTTTANVIVTATPTVTVNNLSLCAGTSGSITASPSASGGTYLWSPDGQTTASITVNPGSSATYSVIYSLNGCESPSATSTVSVTAAPTVTVNNPAVCAGQSVTLNATPSSGGGTYQWTPSGQNTSSITVNPGSSTTYSVEYTLNGCSDTQVSSVTVNPIFNQTQNTTVCANSLVTYPDGFSETVTGPTTHTSVLTSTAGCDSIIVTSVVVNSNYSLNEVVNVCIGTSYTYPDGTSALISNSTSYTSNLFTTSGCDSIIVTNVNAVNTISTSEAIPLCAGANYTYPDGTNVTNVTIDESHVSMLTSGGGCDSIITTYLIISPVPTLSSNNESICAGESIILTATPSISGGTYLWWPNGETTESITVSPSNTSNYTVSYTLNDCTSNTSNSTVTVNPLPDNGTTLQNNIVTANENGATYQWLDCSNSMSPINGATNQSYVPTQNGSYAVQITLNGCVSISTCSTITTIGLLEIGQNWLVIHPNPTDEYIEVNGTGLGLFTYSIFDASGRIMLAGEGEAGQKIRVNLLSSGSYMIDINGTGLYRFVKE